MSWLGLFGLLRNSESETLARLRSSGVRLFQEIDAFRNRRMDVPVDEARRRIESAIETTQQIVQFTTLRLQQLASRKTRFRQYARNLQVENKVFRPARDPDPLDTIMLAVVFMLVEAGVTAAMLVSEGKMEPVPGLAYGMAFALVNVMLGLVAGFLPARYLSYRRYARVQDERDLRIRIAAVIGFVAAMLALLVLIFAAARLRALGSHENVFSFAEVGFLDTFNDGIAIIIVIIGFLSGALAMWKGYGGLSDPVPDLTEAWHSTDDLDGNADDLVEDGIATIEDLRDDLDDEIQPIVEALRKAPRDDRERHTELAAKVVIHNDAVRDAMEACKSRVQAEARERGYIRGNQSPARIPDLSAYRGLLIPPLADQDLPQASDADSAPLEALLDRLHSACEQAVSDIRTQLADYHADTPALDFLLEDDQTQQGEDNASLISKPPQSPV